MNVSDFTQAHPSDSEETLSAAERLSPRGAGHPLLHLLTLFSSFLIWSVCRAQLKLLKAYTLSPFKNSNPRWLSECGSISKTTMSAASTMR